MVSTANKEDVDEEGHDHTQARENAQIQDFLIRSVGDDEVALMAVNELFNEPQIKNELHWFTHRDTLERAANRPDRRVYYLGPPEHLRGAIMVWCESRVLDPDEAQIRLVAVRPNARGYGIGRDLVDRAIAFARSYEKPTMIADVGAETPAVSFWRHLGFERCETYDTGGGRRMFRMRISIM